ncbi:hypothetical protein [Sulfobacillus thermosulfidooxidans]|uniref:hypothetical protein n=1 Tax=Sulfobacillus thermosulfidooxidans TaxID=28034 RepID=UPI001112B85D|nr:hypothetical protein [Sulfobacillus thermosulfidooxidans]
MTNDTFLYLTRAHVELICQQLDPEALVQEVFLLHAEQDTTLPDEAYLHWDNSAGQSVRSLDMPGYLGGAWKVAGTKIINANPANVSRQPPPPELTV